MVSLNDLRPLYYGLMQQFAIAVGIIQRYLQMKYGAAVKFGDLYRLSRLAVQPFHDETYSLIKIIYQSRGCGL